MSEERTRPSPRHHFSQDQCATEPATHPLASALITGAPDSPIAVPRFYNRHGSCPQPMSATCWVWRDQFSVLEASPQPPTGGQSFPPSGCHQALPGHRRPRHRNDDRRGWRSRTPPGTRVWIAAALARTVVSAPQLGDPAPAQARDHRGQAKVSAKEPCKRTASYRPGWVRRAVARGTLAVEGVSSHRHPRSLSAILGRRPTRACGRFHGQHDRCSSTGVGSNSKPPTRYARPPIRLDRCPVLGVRRSPHGCLLRARPPRAKCAGRWGRPGGSRPYRCHNPSVPGTRHPATDLRLRTA